MDETPCLVQQQGGWRTFPYIIGAVSGLSVAITGVSANLLVFLIKQFSITNVHATQIVNVVNGCGQLAPIIGAIVGDTFGCFVVSSISNAICVLSLLLFMLSAMLPSVSPIECSLGVCQAPTHTQFAVLYIAIGLYIIGRGGNSLNVPTFGASQMDNGDDQARFFNLYTIASYSSLIIGTTAIVYIEDNMGWVFGFALCAALSAVSLFLFHLGSPYYRHSERQENPFVTLLRSLVPTTRSGPKSYESLNNYDKLEDGTVTQSQSPIPCESSIDQRSTEETEAFGTIIRLLPLMLTIIPTSLALGMKGSLVTIQAMAMDRHIGPNFLIPAASVPIFSMAATALSILLLDRIVYPRWNLRPLQRMGLSCLVTFLCLVGMAILESRRLASLNSPNGVMSVLWLAGPMLLEGLADALFFPAQLSFYFQQFPESLRSSSAGASSLMSGIGSYLSTAAITLVARYTNWMQDDTDKSRLDNVYWMLAVIVLLNFGYFLLCAVLYKSREKAKL